MDRLRDWDQLDKELNGIEPARVVNEPECLPTRGPTTFGSVEAYTQELDALARESATMQALELRRKQVTSLYKQLDRDIAESEGTLTQGRLMRWGLAVEEELVERTRRYIHRDLAVTHVTVTVQASRQRRQS